MIAIMQPSQDTHNNLRPSYTPSILLRAQGMSYPAASPANGPVTHSAFGYNVNQQLTYQIQPQEQWQQPLPPLQSWNVFLPMQHLTPFQTMAASVRPVVDELPKKKYRRIPIQSLLNPFHEDDNSAGKQQADPERRSTDPHSDPQMRSEDWTPSPSTPELLAHSASSSSDESNVNGEQNTKKRNKWSPEQDAILEDVVQRYGAKDWNYIASFFPGRNADNVRLRYKYFLQYPPNVRDKPFSAEEDLAILREAQLGRQWKRVGHEMGRSCGAVRNRYDVLKRLARRQEREMLKQRQKQECLALKLKQIQELDASLGKKPNQ